MDSIPAEYSPPFWRLAVKNFLSGGFAPGDVVSYDWLYRQFEIERPTDDTPLGRAQKSHLAFLTAFQAFQEALLRDHQIPLQNVKGVGYKVVSPQTQSKWAEDEGDAEIRKSLKKRSLRLVNVNLLALDQDQRRDNANALARLGMLTGMVHRAFKRKSTLEIESSLEEGE